MDLKPKQNKNQIGKQLLIFAPNPIQMLILSFLTLLCSFNLTVVILWHIIGYL